MMRLFAGRAGRRDDNALPARHLVAVAGMAAVTSLAVGVSAAGGLVAIERSAALPADVVPLGPNAHPPPLVVPERFTVPPPAINVAEEDQEDVEGAGGESSESPSKPRPLLEAMPDVKDNPTESEKEEKRDWWLENGELAEAAPDDDCDHPECDRDDCPGWCRDWPLDSSFIDKLLGRGDSKVVTIE